MHWSRALVLIAVVAGLGFATADPPQKEMGVKVVGVVYAARGEKKVAAGASVHLRKLPAGWDGRPSDEPVRMTFSKGRITPKFACLQVGQKVVIKATQGEMFIISAHSTGREPQGVVVGPPDPHLFTDSFAKPDHKVYLKCDLHVTATARLQVVPTPGFALCDDGGRFTLPRMLPKGEHVLIGYYPGLGFAENAITLRGDEGEVTVELYLDPKSKAGVYD